MYRSDHKQIRIAILDLYEAQANEGMRCIRDILQQYSRLHQLELVWDEYEVRIKQQLPDLSYDLYISSGGPGSPVDSAGTEWENKYFDWIHTVEQYNQLPGNSPKKHVLFICHSFQLACRYFEVAEVKRRKSTAFGVFPVHMLDEGHQEALFANLQDPFYAVDSRDYQVVQPNHQRIRQLGASILAIEKERPHVPLERAIMAFRFNEYMVGTQFHPEADAAGMTMYLLREDKKQTVIANHGEAKWSSMIEQLNDPDKIRYTYAHVLPNFLSLATEELVGVTA
ncbi:GMP synthase [Pseudoflavitalea sp. G-6-1-2]|uniref:type 1 glutamine amidotransferase n=1 Tax=Pseudoflavitalea sp. G-6-1-2 TaxID=2728841 RepID=UPI00146BB7B3|nr:GMP synthase [Pseudoflavitalea sp. G-6-1-2]NML22146.1 GMP synthase [Pseudoflavitalea sp. G-6-1-2]